MVFSDGWSRAEKCWDRISASFEAYVRSRLRYEYGRIGDSSVVSDSSRFDAQVHSVVSVVTAPSSTPPRLTPQQRAVLRTEVAGKQLIAILRSALEHRDACRRATSWGPESARSLQYLNEARRLVRAELSLASRNQILASAPPPDETDDIRLLSSNAFVQGVLILVITSALLPVLGFFHLSGFFGSSGNPLAGHLSLLDATNAGVFAAPSGVLSIGTYLSIGLYKRIQWSPWLYSFAYAKFPAPMEAGFVLLAYVPLVVLELSGLNFAWRPTFYAVLIGVVIYPVTYISRYLAFHFFRHDRIIGLAASFAVLLAATAVFSGSVRRARQDADVYSHIFTTQTAVYDTCHYSVLRPVPRLLVLNARTAHHTIVVPASIITESIRLDPGTLSCDD